MIEIVNLRRTKPSQSYDFRIDRGTPVGNPFYMRSEADRDQVCDRYDIWFTAQMSGNPLLIAYVRKLVAAYETHKKLRLFCWCAPSRCHGETIKKAVELLIKEG